MIFRETDVKLCEQRWKELRMFKLDNIKLGENYSNILRYLKMKDRDKKINMISLIPEYRI